MARMPESKKVTLKTMVGAEVEAVLGQRPDLQLVKIADGANDNWTFLSRVLPEGVELIDFFHAAEHLSDAFDAAYGANDPKAVAQFEKYRHLLRYDDDGVAQVIRALRHLQFEASRVRTYRASPGLLPQQSTPHGLCRGEGPRIAYRLRGGRGDVQDLGH